MIFNERERDVIIYMAECDMNIGKVAKKMYMCRNAINYHREQIKKKTNLDVHKFYDLVKLLDMLKESENE